MLIIQVYFRISVCFFRVFVEVVIDLTNWETGKFNIKFRKVNISVILSLKRRVERTKNGKILIWFGLLEIALRTIEKGALHGKLTEFKPAFKLRFCLKFDWQLWTWYINFTCKSILHQAGCFIIHSGKYLRLTIREFRNGLTWLPV